MTSLPGALAVALSALLLAACSSTERSAAPVETTQTTSASSVATPSDAPSVEVSSASESASASASASASTETISSSPSAEALPSDAAVQGASKSTRVCVVNRDTIGNRFDRVIWYKYDTNTGMKMRLNESVCAEGGFSSQPDVEGTITIADGADMMNNTTEIKFTAFNPGAGYPWIELTGPGVDTGTMRLSEGGRFLVSAQAPERERRLLTIERLPDTQWKEFRITISTPRACEVGGICAVGDTGPGGGIVFYDAGSTQAWGRYLEVAPYGWSGRPDDPQTNWCTAGSDGSSRPHSQESAIGSGRANTVIGVRDCPDATTAPSLALNYDGGGKKDWYLPAKDEIVALFIAARSENNLFNGILTTEFYELNRGYWSSTSCTSTGHVFAKSFSLQTKEIGCPPTRLKDYFVRPIRAF